MEIEGIFQKDSSPATVEALFKQGADLDLSHVGDVHLVASLLKKQLTSLRPPIISVDGDTYSEILSALDITENQRVWFLHEMLEDSLTTSAFARARLVFSLFNDFLQNSSANHLSTNLLAKTFGELLLVNEESDGVPTELQEKHKQIVSIIFENYQELFGQQ